MKTNKTTLIFSIVLAVACLFQLSFTWKSQQFEKSAKEFAKKMASKGMSEKEAYSRYIDSLGNSEIYSMGIAGFNYYECKKKEINLGLDLRGGINVILEVDKGAVVKVLSNDGQDKDLVKAIELANIDVRDKGLDFVDAFVANFKTIAPNRKLANLFAKGNKGVIQANSSEDQVVNYIREETNNAVNLVYEVVEKRINQSNVTQPTINITDNGRISVELPGVDNPRRMEELVEKSAKLEFFEVFGNDGKRNDGKRIYDALVRAASLPAKNAVATADTNVTSVDTAKPATTPVANLAVENTKDSNKANTGKAAATVSNALSKIMTPFGANGLGSSVAVVKKSNRALLEKMISTDARLMDVLASENARVAFSAKPRDFNANGSEAINSDEYFVYFLKLDRDGKAALASEEENIIEDARVNTSQKGELEVSMMMNSEAATRWAQITAANVGKYIAIVLDNRVYSAPVVNGKIPGGQSNITGNFDIREANDLANVLKAGKLPAPAKIVSSNQVGASLGEDAQNAGLLSLIAGFLVTILFMVLYYNRAGWIAIVAVLGNVLLIFGTLSSLGAALTLPGIAGIILTVGMAVDANVLIYERIKDELALGKSLKSSIDAGFKHALGAILDSNITTLLAGFILTFAGAGPTYGFAVILVIGIFSSMYTALFITRLLLDRRAEKGLDTKFGFDWNKNFLKGKSIDFISKRKVYYWLTSPILILGIILFVKNGGISTGIDFKGGNSFVIKFDKSQNYKVDQIKETLDGALKESSNEVKTYGEEGQFRIVTTYKLSSESKEGRDSVKADVLAALKGFKMMGDDPVVQAQRVGASIATSTRDKSAFLVILTVIGMFIYIVFRFRSIAYGLGATIALIHDIVFVLAVFAILDGIVPFPIEFDQHLIAALLTLLGYSMNDTVIVFDRIREFLAEKRGDMNSPETINKAINETLSRTIITASTVFMVVLILFLFGGDALKGFSLAMLIGVIVGTYSSICIATPVVIDFTNKKKSK